MRADSTVLVSVHHSPGNRSEQHTALRPGRLTGSRRRSASPVHQISSLKLRLRDAESSSRRVAVEALLPPSTAAAAPQGLPTSTGQTLSRAGEGSAIPKAPPAAQRWGRERKEAELLLRALPSPALPLSQRPVPPAACLPAPRLRRSLALHYSPAAAGWTGLEKRGCPMRSLPKPLSGRRREERGRNPNPGRAPGSSKWVTPRQGGPTRREWSCRRRSSHRAARGPRGSRSPFPRHLILINRRPCQLPWRRNACHSRAALAGAEAQEGEETATLQPLSCTTQSINTPRSFLTVSKESWGFTTAQRQTQTAPS